MNFERTETYEQRIRKKRMHYYNDTADDESEKDIKSTDTAVQNGSWWSLHNQRRETSHLLLLLYCSIKAHQVALK